MIDEYANSLFCRPILHPFFPVSFCFIHLSQLPLIRYLFHVNEDGYIVKILLPHLLHILLLLLFRHCLLIPMLFFPHIPLIRAEDG